MGQMFSKIVGTTFAGTQADIAALKSGDELVLEQEPNNPFDSNAIAIVSNGKKLGHLPRATAEMVTKILSENPVFCHVSEVTGGLDKNVGCNIKLTW